MMKKARPKNLLKTAITIYVLLLASILSVVLIVNLTDTTPRIRRDIDATNLSRIANIHQLSDRALREIDRTSLSLIDSSDIRRILLDDMRPTYPRAQSLENFKQATSSVVSLHELVAFITTFSESSRYVFTSGYYMPVDDFPDQSWREHYDSPDFHSGWLGTRQTQWIKYGSYDTYAEELITLVRLYPLNTTNNLKRGAVMLHIRAEDYREMLSYNVEDETEVFVADGEGRLIIGNSRYPIGTDINAALNLEALVQAELRGEGLQAKQGEETLRAYVSTSDYTGWHYIMLVDESVAFRSLENVRMVLLWTAAILLIIGIVSLLMMKRWVYAPIQGFIGELHKSLNPNPAQKPDYALSFDAMVAQFSDIVTDREKVMNQLTVSLPAIRKQLFLDILMGYADSYEITKPQLEYMNVQLLPAHYVVVLLDVRPDGVEAAVLKRAVVHALLEIAEREMLECCVGCATSLDNGLIACILSFPRGKAEENLQEGMEFARRLTAAVQAEMNTYSTAGVGGHYDDFEDIHLSYREALEALKMNPFAEQPESVSQYADNQPEQPGVAHALLSQANAVMDALRTGDEALLVRSMDVFYESIEQAALPPASMHSLYRMIQLQAASIALEAGVEQDAAFQDETLAARQVIDTAVEPEALDKAVRKLLLYYTGIISAGRSDPVAGQTQAEAIGAYLEAHYADPMLSQGSTAEALGLSPSYLSRLFRQTTGESFTDTLASIRIEKAKELLSQPNASVNMVAEQVGYLSPHTFIRTFKKVTGNTPGRWMKGKPPEEN